MVSRGKVGLASPQNASDDLKQNAIAQTFTAVLKELTPIQDHKEAVQALSFALGQEILQPLSNEKDIASASKKIGEWADKGKVKTPGNCGKDLFRFTPRMNIIGKDDSTPINRSVFEGLEGTDKSEKTGTQMIGILNQVYREISGLDEDLITKGDFEKIDSQDNAAAFAEKFSSILDKKGIEQDHKEVLMQFLSLIGMQEIPTRVGDWAIPGGQNPSDEKAAPLNDYRKGVQNLQVAEFSPAYVNATQPLQYARTMDFKILENGKFELQIYSPITFQDKSEMTKQAVGTCGVVSTLVFNSKLEFETMSQKVVPAEIKP